MFRIGHDKHNAVMTLKNMFPKIIINNKRTISGWIEVDQSILN